VRRHRCRSGPPQGYCNEFSYPFDRRGEQLQMFDGTLKSLLHGEVLPYKKLTAKVSV